MLKQAAVAIIFLSIMLNAGFTQTKIGLNGTLGYFAPQGEWKNHMYAEGVNQFQGGYSTFGDFEIKFGDVAFSLIFNYSKMSTADWEEFVRKDGGNINASASQGQIGSLLKYYVSNSQPHLFNIQAGAVYLSLKSSEQFNGYTYEYDFLNPGLAVLFGLEYQISLNDKLSFIFPIRALWRPEGIKYTDGRSFDIFGFYITPGLRFTFGF